jgi:hypothetical protein
LRANFSLLKLTTLEDVCRFVRDELASRGARTALLSAVLGELEEVQRQANTLPLTTFFHTHAAFESFVNRELAPTLAKCHGRAEQLQFVARRAWCDRTLIAGRKRKFMYMSGHIWHFVNSDMCNEFCFVLVALCAVRSLGIRNVYAVLSESHCWLGYVPDERNAAASGDASGAASADVDTKSSSTVKSEYDDDNVPPLTALEFLDILPPDRSRDDIISPISESRVGWAYQRDARGVQRAVVLTPQQLVAAMLVHVELTPDVKLPLLCSVPDDVALSLPNFVLAQAMCYHACGDVVQAALLYDCAVDVARQRFGDALVYPLMQRAEFRVSMGHFGEALSDFADMARIIRSYKLLETDAEMLDEATVAAAHVCDNVIPALVAQFSDDIAVLRAHFEQRATVLRPLARVDRGRRGRSGRRVAHRRVARDCASLSGGGARRVWQTSARAERDTDESSGARRAAALSRAVCVACCACSPRASSRWCAGARRRYFGA